MTLLGLPTEVDLSSSRSICPSRKKSPGGLRLCLRGEKKRYFPPTSQAARCEHDSWVRGQQQQYLLRSRVRPTRRAKGASREREKVFPPLLVQHEPLARRLQFRTQSEKLLHRSDGPLAAALEAVEVIPQAEAHRVVADELPGGKAAARVVIELPGPDHQFGGDFLGIGPSASPLVLWPCTCQSRTSAQGQRAQDRRGGTCPVPCTCPVQDRCGQVQGRLLAWSGQCRFVMHPSQGYSSKLWETRCGKDLGGPGGVSLDQLR